MPSLLHDAIVDLFRDHPGLLVHLGVVVPTGESLQIVDPGLTTLVPAELRADLALVVGEPPRLGLLVEVQLQRDADKRYTWPSYAAALAARWRCPATVVVVAPDERVARWAAAPIAFALGTGHLAPIVIGPEVIPVVSDPALAESAPDLALLSALAHGEREAGPAVLLALARVMGGLPSDRARVYHDVVLARLSPARQAYLEEAMRDFKGYEPASEWARKHWNEGKAEGHAEGRAEGEAQLVLRQLVRRVGMLGEERQAQVRALPLDQLEALGEALLDFSDLAELDAWLAASR